VATLPQPAEDVVVPAGGNINDAIVTHPAGATIIVEGGVYDPIVIEPGTVFGPIFIEAGDEELGPVTIIGEGEEAAIVIDGQTNVKIDGLRIVGGEEAGIYVVDSDAIEIRNCVVSRATHGVVFERSMTGTLFDTLVFGNEVNGVAGLGTTGFRIVNNTIFGQSGSGIFLDSSPGDGVAILASDTLVQNNIIDGNLGVGIKVAAGNEGSFSGRYNINNDGYQGVGSGFRDLVDVNPLFIFPPASGASCGLAECDFRVQVASGGRSSPAIDRGDPDMDPVLLTVLRDRTIRSDNFSDGEVPDMGYHYPFGMVTPTPFPTTPTPGAGGPTRTPTATPTPA
jgi:parallel beta-helix repeat protein